MISRAPIQPSICWFCSPLPNTIIVNYSDLWIKKLVDNSTWLLNISSSDAAVRPL